MTVQAEGISEMLYNSYMYLIPKFFNEQETGQIEAIALQKKIQTSKIGPSVTDPDAEVQTGNTDDRIRQATNAWIEPNELPQNLHDKLWAGTMEAKQACGWNYNIEYMEPGQYTIYDQPKEKQKGDFYTWHTDATPNLYDNGMQRKISTCVQLSDPDDYEGGWFEWIESEPVFNRIKLSDGYLKVDDFIHTIPFSAKEKGSLMVFPAWVHHQVTPIIWGTRKSFITWFCGYPLV